MKIIKFLKNPYRLIAAIISKNNFVSHMISDEYYLRIKFRAIFGRKLDLDNPKTYNEKLQWLKLYDRKPIYSTMVDKYEAKKYVANIIGNEYIIPTYGIYDRFEDIDFNSLPNEFVLKCTHDSGGVVICKDKTKLDLKKMRKKINKRLKTNYYYEYREWPYKNVKPRIIIEKYMTEQCGSEPNDYKVLCFNGEPKLIELHMNRFTDRQTQDFYDVEWNKTTISQTGVPEFKVNHNVFPKPANLDEMLEMSRILSKNFVHLRVDWYLINGRLYFGELTFYDGSGLEPWDDPKDDLMLGSLVDLDQIIMNRI